MQQETRDHRQRWPAFLPASRRPVAFAPAPATSTQETRTLSNAMISSAPTNLTVVVYGPGDAKLATYALRRGRHESERFTRALVELGAHGLRTHCSDAGSHNLWLSDHVSDRREATRLCIGCPVLELCRQAAVARRERFGVFGGRDFTPSPKKALPE
jgi:hypothetical protein